MPSARPLARYSGVSVALAALVASAAFAFADVAAAQPANPGAELGFGTRVAIVAVVNFLVAGGLVALSPRYATEKVNEIRDDPAAAFGWGLVVGVGVPLGLALVAITIIGLLVAVPGLILLAFVGLVGNAVAIVWVGAALTGTDGGVGGKAAAVGALVLAVPGAIPVIGRLVTALAGLFGLGVVGRGLYESWRE